MTRLIYASHYSEWPMIMTLLFFLRQKFIDRRKIHLITTKARFKRRILHAPNRIAKLSACKMRRLNQLNATYFNSSRIFD